MTVKELIDILNTCDENAMLLLNNGMVIYVVLKK